MPPAVANIVSDLFYHGRLVTAPSISADAAARGDFPAIKWHAPEDVSAFGRKRGLGGAAAAAAHPPGEQKDGTSCINRREAAQIRFRYKQLRRRLGAAATVMVITFYKAQLGVLCVALRQYVDRGCVLTRDSNSTYHPGCFV